MNFNTNLKSVSLQNSIVHNLIVGGDFNFFRLDAEQTIKNYFGNKPNFMCISEYIVNEEYVGILIIFYKYSDSTHYELFKKNTFTPDAKFERILFLDEKSLKDETKNYIDYVKNVLKLNIEGREDFIYIVLDTMVKKDRIYEYKIKATRIPQKVDELDFDAILESKSSVNYHHMSSGDTLKLWSANIGGEKYSWIIALMNEQIPYFSYDILSYKKPLTALTPSIILPKNLNDLILMFKESINLFGLKNTMRRMLELLGGDISFLMNPTLASLDEKNNLFSYTLFDTNFYGEIKNSTASTNDIITPFSFFSSNKSNTQETTTENKSESLTTLEGISNVLFYLAAVYVARVRVQDTASNIANALSIFGGSSPSASEIESAFVSSTSPEPPASTLNSTQASTSTSTSTSESTTNSSYNLFGRGVGGRF